MFYFFFYFSIAIRKTTKLVKIQTLKKFVPEFNPPSSQNEVEPLHEAFVDDMIGRLYQAIYSRL